MKKISGHFTPSLDLAVLAIQILRRSVEKTNKKQNKKQAGN